MITKIQLEFEVETGSITSDTILKEFTECLLPIEQRTIGTSGEYINFHKQLCNAKATMLSITTNL